MYFTFIVRHQSENLSDLEKCIISIKNQPKVQSEIIVLVEENIDKAEALRERFDFTCISSEGTSYKDSLKAIEKNIKGDYIQVIDSRDTIAIDWCYEAEKASMSDIILGYQVYSGDKVFDYNLSLSKSLEKRMTKKALLKIYYNHGGEDRYLTKLNNKLIKNTLFFTAINEATEEIAEVFFFEYLNILCLSMAESIYCMQNTHFIYGMSKEEKVYGKPYEIVIQHYSELMNAIKQLSIHSNIELFEEWEKDWWRELVNTLYLYNPLNLVDILKHVQSEYGEYFNPTSFTSYFEKLTTELGYSFNYYNSIKEHIASIDCKTVGFDMFDTLIERPFWEPTDLFFLLNKEYNKLIGKNTVIDFSLIRKSGENACRAYYHSIRPANEDVTIDEIYDFISQKYGISEKIAIHLKEYEISLEEKYCKYRRIGKELFEWALYCGKDIYVISDMYLKQDILEKILRKNGYQGYKKLYLSNEIGVSKYSGNLYAYFLKEEEIKAPNTVCFIGDNYAVDYLNSKKYGMIAYHVPKAVDIFQGLNGAIYSREFFEKMYGPNGGIVDQGTALKFMGIRCMLAVVANEFFGNPFVSFNATSDFNADGRMIGYFCAGMFLFSEALWLNQESVKNKNETIHFIARDGFYVKAAYDKLMSVFDRGAQSNYLWFSRKAVAPLYLTEPEGIYELFLPPHILSNTPQKIIQFLNVVVHDNIDTDEILTRNGIIPFKKFASLNEFYVFAEVFIREIYDYNKALQHKDILYEYYRDIVGKRDAIFDVGYSGRMETALTKMLGYPVNSYYFHEHEPWALMRKENIGFSINSFYNFKPCSAFVLREQIFTPNQPSCVGFTRKNGRVEPEFGTYKIGYKEEFVLSNIQKWALKFVDDMIEIYGEDLKQLYFNKFDACIPFEYLMHYAKTFDRIIMSAVEFEDEFGTNDVLSICDYWNREKEIYHLNVSKPSGELISETVKKQIREEVYREEGIFVDGEFMRLYHMLNRFFPIGSGRRKVLKAIVKKKTRK